jgi:hypothetical protein
MRAPSGSSLASPMPLTCEEVVEDVSCFACLKEDAQDSSLPSCECSSFAALVIACPLGSAVEILVETG